MDIRYQRLNGAVPDLLGKGGVRERLEGAGVDPVQTSIDLGDYGSYLSDNNQPLDDLREELAAQLFAKMRSAEVMNFLRAKEFKDAENRGELPF